MMINDNKSYSHDLGDGLTLDAYIIDPNISIDNLKNMILSKDGITTDINLERTAKIMPVRAKLNSFNDLSINISKEVYHVPKQLKPFREALEDKLISEGKFNGNIMVIKGDVRQPLTLLKGGFFDFKATQLTSIPSELLPSLYPKNKNIAELLPGYGLNITQMARYLGFAFIMMPNCGQEIGFVQRAKGLGIAADVMALSGATPEYHDDFLKEGFNFQEYFKQVIEKELNEEYKLKSNEIEIGKSYLIDDTREIPFIAIEIITPLSTKEMAQRAYGDKEIIKEHPILYNINPKAVDKLINRFPIFESSAYIMDMITR